VRNYPLDIDGIVATRDKFRSTHLHTDFVKIFLDGVPTASRTALMLDDYIVDEEHPQPTRGLLMVEPDTLKGDLIALDKLGFTVKIHAAGDGSVRIALDALQAVREANGPSGLRHELAHAGFIDAQDLPRFAALGVTADLSPYIWYPSPVIDSVVGAIGKRGLDYFPVRDLLDSGANVLMGSDWPSVAKNLSPWHAIEALVTRRNPFEDTEETLWAEQAISLEQALAIATMGGAKAMRLEQLTGSIEVGKSADFIILDRNLFEVPITAISDTQVEQTWFEGQPVYTKGDQP
jgi:predicted amidohydrolase YtcJ